MSKADARKYLLPSRKTKRPSKPHISLKLELPFQCPDGINLTLDNVLLQDTISNVKLRLEQEIGILNEMYYLSYLDTVPMEDSSKLQDHDIVNGATLRVNVWRMWQELLNAAFTGNIKGCFSCSLNITGHSDWSQYCAWVALYIASHHGYHHLVAELLKKTLLPINLRSACSGWTALHAAGSMGRWKVLCMLIEYGIDVRITNKNDLTAFELSRNHGHKKCGNSLTFCQWNLQKHQIVQERRLDYDAKSARQAGYRLTHQTLDSTMSFGFRGRHGQVYTPHIPNPTTVAMVDRYEREERLPKAAIKQQLHMKHEEEKKQSDDGRKLEFNYGWFDGLRAQQLIPPTYDILKYSDPSSCQLRSRSLLNPEGYKLTLLYSTKKSGRS